MVDAILAGLKGQDGFLELVGTQFCADLGTLLGRQGEIKGCVWLDDGSAEARWMVARFELKGSKALGILDLSMNRKQAVTLAADMVRAPAQSMLVAGDLTEMVADAMGEAANVCGAALARVFKQTPGGTESCHMEKVAWGNSLPPAGAFAWKGKVEIAFNGLKEPITFILTLEA